MQNPEWSHVTTNNSISKPSYAVIGESTDFPYEKRIAREAASLHMGRTSSTTNVVARSVRTLQQRIDIIQRGQAFAQRIKSSLGATRQL